MNLGSIVNRAQQAAQTAVTEVKAKVEQTVAAVEQGAQQVQHAADAFDQVHSLYQPGLPGRATLERTVGTTTHFDGRNPNGVGFVESAARGLTGRVYAEEARKTLAAGVEGFAGDHFTSTEVKANGETHSLEQRLGIGGSAVGFVGVVNGVRGKVQAGLEVTETTTTRTALGGNQQLKAEDGVTYFLGAVAEGSGQVGAVTGGKVDLFVGARGTVGGTRTLVENGREVIGASLSGGAMVGFGVTAEGEAGYDFDKEQVTVHGGLGAAFGIGGHAEGGVTLGGVDEPVPAIPASLFRTIRG